MKFLDSNGLTHFWSKIKDWSNSNFFSNEGGEISPKSGLHYIINGEQLDVSKTGNENESISIFNVDENGISAKRIVMTGGTATQVLMADGSVKTLNANNGIAGLDSNGNVPLAQLGNLDTTVAEVEATLQHANYVIEHIEDYKNQVVRCEEVLKELNPQFAKNKARDERIAGIENEVAGMKGDIAKILAAITKQ